MISATNIPSEELCYQLMDEHDMLPNIKAHSILVKKVAVAIVDAMIDPSSINRNAIIAGALLHDIAKTRSIRNNEPRHDIIGAAMVKEMGFGSIADIIEFHVVLNGFNPDSGPNEIEIVHYSDKRVKHDKIVSLDERFEDLLARYGITEGITDNISQYYELSQELEKKIQRFLKSDLEGVIYGLTESRDQA